MGYARNDGNSCEMSGEFSVGRKGPDAPEDTSGRGETCTEVYEAAGGSVPSLTLSYVFRHILYILLPSPCLGCRQPVLRPGRAPGLCPTCVARLVPASEPLSETKPGAATWAFEYRPPLDEVILALKFRRLDYLAEPLAELAAPAAAELVERVGGVDAVVPVPLHWRRTWRRGYDQADALAAALSRRLGLPVRRPLRRVRSTPAQSLRGRGQRQRNLEDAFAVRRGSVGRIDGLRLLLVDDVVTTGSTLRASVATLLAGGATAVHPFAVAWTPEEGSEDDDSGAPERAKKET